LPLIINKKDKKNFRLSKDNLLFFFLHHFA
jgi:hypothetical protein